jgi:hypothetical protein
MLLATELLLLGRGDEALQETRDAIAAQPDYHELYILAAAIELERGNLDSAEQYLDQALAAPSLTTPIKVANYRARINEKRAEQSAASTRPAAQPK